MAIAKRTVRQISQMRKRTTWTTFSLPPEQQSPEWPAGSREIYQKPLADVAGCLKIKLGRRLDDPSQAALVIVWESADAFKNFQQTSACEEILRILGYTDDDPSHFCSMRWDVGFYMSDEAFAADELHGRITLTILTVPYSGRPQYLAWRRAIVRSFGSYLPRSCDPGPRPLPYHWWTHAWVDDGTMQERSDDRDHDQEPQQEQPPEAEGEVEAEEQKQTQCYLFFRWNGNGATLEKEEAWAKDPEEQVRWERAAEESMPPVSAWKSERWHIHLAPQPPPDLEE